jgi:hypothetical protein
LRLMKMKMPRSKLNLFKTRKKSKSTYVNILKSTRIRKSTTMD